MIYSWKIGGPAGYGIKSTGALFAKTLIQQGYFAHYYSEYPSLIRGGHNTVQVDFSEDQVKSSGTKIDILVALDQKTLDKDMSSLARGGFVIYDKSECYDKKLKNVLSYHIPLTDLSKKTGGGAIMRNTVALGATMAFLNFDLTKLNKLLEKTFKDKSKDVIKDNREAAQAGYEYILENYPDRETILSGRSFSNRGKVFLSGNEATALGALGGGCNYFAAYPMTPSTAILHCLAQRQREEDIVVHQGEDEIGVIHEALGASFAGARVMITTSGGGFALMNEGLSLSGMTETPLVIVEVIRPAPATGLPTWTDQGDLSFVLSAGHGDFPKVVLTPGDVEECYNLTHKALNLAETYQLPVIILTDKAVGESKYTSSKTKLTSGFSVQRGDILEKAPADYKRYKNIEKGVSPRTLPGTPGGEHIANSDEHDEKGFTVEGFSNDRNIQMDKRQRKMERVVSEMDGPEIYGKKEADLTLVSWGSNKGPILDALNEIDHTVPNKDYSINYIHFTHVWPLPKKKIRKVFNGNDKLLLVECNQSGQLGKVLRQELGIDIKARFLKYDGKPFFRQEIIDRIKKVKFTKKRKSNLFKNIFN